MPKIGFSILLSHIKKFESNEISVEEKSAATGQTKFVEEKSGSKQTKV